MTGKRVATLPPDPREAAARGSAAAVPRDAEAAFREVLADVMRLDRVAADSHFFDDLGADSLVMAHFCARVRKRAELPPVSMRDVYAHPTAGELATALATTAAPASPAVGTLPAPPPTAATGRAGYLLC
ncbi:acyl carrier protein, partial [Streptomyces sp. AC154]|uniref:acyl carrier protein n=1 Tax=Streptomyces sp. AC154 TaxID=3143184 RepID=UPI003F7D9FFA